MSAGRATSTILCVGALAGLAQADQEEVLLRDGAYEVEVRLEIPNLETWATTTTATICIPDPGARSNAPLPVLSSNNPLAACPARNVRQADGTLSFEIVCDGRDAARARALYTLKPGGFTGRIAMVMGAKNMTMTEVQVGRRIGRCDPAGMRPD